MDKNTCIYRPRLLEALAGTPRWPWIAAKGDLHMLEGIQSSRQLARLAMPPHPPLANHQDGALELLGLHSLFSASPSMSFSECIKSYSETCVVA